MEVADKVVNAAKTELSWLQRHERIVICALILGVGLWLGNKWLNYSAADTQSKAAIAAQQATDAKQAAQQANASAQQIAASYQETVRAQQAQITVLLNTIAQRDSQLKTDQSKIQTAPLTDVANQWQTAIGGQGDISATANGVSVTDAGARKTVTQLLELPVVKANLADETKVAEARQIELNDANKNITALNTQVMALNNQIAADDKSCKAQISEVKAEDRKHSRNWFIGGLISGGLIAAKVISILP